MGAAAQYLTAIILIPLTRSILCLDENLNGQSLIQSSSFVRDRPIGFFPFTLATTVKFDWEAVFEVLSNG